MKCDFRDGVYPMMVVPTVKLVIRLQKASIVLTFPPAVGSSIVRAKLVMSKQAVANAQKRANEARGDERMLESESSFRADSSAALPPVRLPADTPSSVDSSFELDASKDKATVPPPSPAPA